MKKRLLLLVLALMVFLAACQSGSSSIRPAKFSKETQGILDTIRDTYFYDLSIGDEMKGYTVDYWSFDGDAWSRETILYDDQLTPGTFRFGFRIQDESLNFYSDKATTDISRLMCPEQGQGGAGCSTLSTVTTIESGTDIVLYHYIISASGKLYNSWFGNFDTTEYDGGTALTITFYDHPLED